MEKRGLDQIEIRRLEVFAKHGVLEEENILGQKFFITAVLFLDAKDAGEQDDLSCSVNYAEVAGLIEKEASCQIFRLLEALAEHLAKKILLTYQRVEEVTIRIEKPWAPIGLPLETVSVEIHRAWHALYLGIGSNLGEKRNNLEEAIRLLSEDPETKVIRISSFIVTEPVGYTEQDDFLNGAVYVRSLRSPEGFLALIHEIERRLKRERIIHWGPRTIDLDILFYDEQIIQTEALVIPHRELTKRRFVLEPLSEIAPYLIHPVHGKRIMELLEALDEK